MSTESQKNLKNFSIEEWQNHFNELYGEVNRKISHYKVIAKLVEEVGDLVIPVNNLDKEQLKKQLPDVFAWCYAVANKLGIDMSPVLKKEYFDKRKLPKIFEVKNTLEDYIKEPPQKFSDWQDYMQKLYGEINKSITPHGMIINILKDLRDLIKAFMVHNKEEITSKLASIFAWSFAISSKFGIDIEEQMIDRYKVCPKCGKKPCECRVIKNISLITNLSEEDTDEIIDLLDRKSIKVHPIAINERKEPSDVLNIFENSDVAIFLIKSFSNTTNIATTIALARARVRSFKIYIKNEKKGTVEAIKSKLAYLGIDNKHIQEYNSIKQLKKRINSYIDSLKPPMT